MVQCYLKINKISKYCTPSKPDKYNTISAKHGIHNELKYVLSWLIFLNVYSTIIVISDLKWILSLCWKTIKLSILYFFLVIRTLQFWKWLFLVKSKWGWCKEKVSYGLPLIFVIINVLDLLSKINYTICKGFNMNTASLKCSDELTEIMISLHNPP